jgi:PilZ domain
MSMPTGRSEKRTPTELAVELSHVGKTFVKERVLTENLSSRGLRVVTKSMWPPGARVCVSFAGEEIDERARIVYCQRLANKRFAVGLELSATVKQSDD